MRDVHAEDADTCGRCQVVPEIDEWSRVVLRGLADGRGEYQIADWRA